MENIIAYLEYCGVWVRTECPLNLFLKVPVDLEHVVEVLTEVGIGSFDVASYIDVKNFVTQRLSRIEFASVEVATKANEKLKDLVY